LVLWNESRLQKVCMDGSIQAIKSQILPDGMALHKCPWCHEPDEMQEHILKCQHVGAHKKQYDLIHPLMKKIRQNNRCPTQEVFTKFVRSWLESQETIILVMSSVHESATTWINSKGDCWPRPNWMAYGNVRLSQQALEISHFFVNHHLEENNDNGEVWVHKTVMLLWGFAHEMWDHQILFFIIQNSKPLMWCMMLRSMMQSLSCMRRSKHTQQRIDGTLMFCWLSNYTSHYGQGNDG
jgi:hypothetical protein